ncbi:MAG: gamma-glutamylcyclotransferase [Myxococcota bacterium]|jgi:gamma-glutamylcyclotransferase (GGCT)/AIG2-like uncharacterized protein YtfP|nr:gamma-glutamylcyclotransferase [Myxococcota bacterium]
MSARVVVSGEELRLDRDLRDGVEIARRGYVVASGRGRALPLFVYGSLRRGRSAASLLERWSPTWLGEARVHGVLYDLGEYPGWCPFELRPHGFSGSALTRDDEARGVEARGVEARGVEARGVEARGVVARGVVARGVEARDDWGFVRGELVVLPDPERALEALDAYEDFFTYDDPRSLYLRVPTRVQLIRGDAWEETTAWAYAWNGHGEHPIVASGCWER